MPINKPAYQKLMLELQAANATLVAVSKAKPMQDVQDLYNEGHRDFGENYVQELTEKYESLPKDIRWHFIGHLQSNKVKYIVPFVHLIHGVDTVKLLKEIDKQAGKHGKKVDCLLQMFIAQEETKFGLDDAELADIMQQYKSGALAHIKLKGLMGMATLTADMEEVRKEFNHLKTLFEKHAHGNEGWEILSMGMTADYKVALEEGSNMVRIGSMLFGERTVHAH